MPLKTVTDSRTPDLQLPSCSKSQ